MMGSPIHKTLEAVLVRGVKCSDLPIDGITVWGDGLARAE
jgi:hypothetical protein